jgi:WD40 repeat protein
MVATEAHSDGINCLDFNPFNPHIIATGSADHTVTRPDRLLQMGPAGTSASQSYCQGHAFRT